MGEDLEAIKSGGAETAGEAAERRRLRIYAAVIDVVRLGLGDLDSSSTSDPIDADATPEEVERVVGRILTELPENEVEEAFSTAQAVKRAAKPMCRHCRGRAIVKHVAVLKKAVTWAFCECVHRRVGEIRARRAVVEVPGRQAQVAPATARVERDRLVEARAVLERAVAAQAEACADLDARIADVEQGLAGYTAERAMLQAALAANTEQSALCGRAQMTAHGHAEYHEERAEALAIELGRGVQVELERRGDPGAFYDRAVPRRTTFKEAGGLLVQVRHHLGQADWWRGWREGFGAYRREADGAVGQLEHDVARLDEANRSASSALVRLREERARVARHHQPKVERAERRVSRLAYIAGSVEASP